MFAPTKFTPAARPPLRKPPPLDFAQLIAQRRANRVAQNTQMQADTNHFWNLKNSIELGNAFQEKERMAVHLRLGRVPAHIGYPIIAALRGYESPGSASDGEESSGMEVDAGVPLDGIDPKTGLVIEMGKRGPGNTALKGKTQTTTLKNAKLAKLLAFTDGERKVKLQGEKGREARANHPEDVASRNAKTVQRNKVNRKIFAATYASELANAKEKVDSTARRVAREARELRKRTA